MIIVAIYQPQLQGTHVRLCVHLCVSVCVYVFFCVCDNTKNNGSIHLKLEHIVAMNIARRSSTLGIVRSRSKSQRDFEIFLHLPQYKLSSPLSQLWHKLESCD